MSNQSILITGGTGFLGSALAFKLLHAGKHVVVFGRSSDKIVRTFGDQVQAVSQISDLPDAGSFQAIVNLAGAGIFDQRWNDKRKQVLRDSRIQLTQQLVDWIAGSEQKPEVLLNGSAIGIYGEHGDELITEQSSQVADFSQQLCADWETTALQAEALGVRVCLIRTGLVLGLDGGLLKRMLLPFRMGLGGRLGNGQQWMSWIHLQDWLALAQLMIENSTLQGAYNASAPAPVTNAEFSAALAATLNRPMLLPLPEVVLKPLLGEMSALILGSQRVLPKRLIDQGFEFQFPKLDLALQNLLN
ncbi:MAG: TIGR01777 family oxidoreductase [Methylomonas lenta]|jgi:uncharacterized protein (TIGR01777 family)|nr:TIGR01777 family oxidoreductase [Methylomonas lenta]